MIVHGPLVKLLISLNPSSLAHRALNLLQFLRSVQPAPVAFPLATLTETPITIRHREIPMIGFLALLAEREVLFFALPKMRRLIAEITSCHFFLLQIPECSSPPHQ
jgi:hypothetical protein